MFQLTAARRRLVNHPISIKVCASFNSQPPEGGWQPRQSRCCLRRCFNSQPPEGGWLCNISSYIFRHMFQLTAARRRLEDGSGKTFYVGSFNSQPPEGGWSDKFYGRCRFGCFNSQPPEGGWHIEQITRRVSDYVSTHSRPKAAGRKKSS